MTRHSATKRGLRRSVWAVALGMATIASWLLLDNTRVANAGDRSRVPEARYTGKGVEACINCHAGDTILVMAETAHGNRDDPHAPYSKDGCESCHGPGSLHISRARGGAGFPPLLSFGRRGDPVTKQLAACLGCHAEPMAERQGMAWAGSIHDTGRMTCSSCHRMHTTDDPMTDSAQQSTNCTMCHEEQITNHNRFEGKGIVFDTLSCATCHDVHQLVSKGS